LQQVVKQHLPASSNYYSCRLCHSAQPCHVLTRDGEALRSYNVFEMRDTARALNKAAEATRRANSLGYQKARVHEMLAHIVADTSSLTTLQPG